MLIGNLCGKSACAMMDIGWMTMESVGKMISIEYQKHQESQKHQVNLKPKKNLEHQRNQKLMLLDALHTQLGLNMNKNVFAGLDIKWINMENVYNQNAHNSVLMLLIMMNVFAGLDMKKMNMETVF